ncbi:MAG: phosphotransferase [Anaerolineales bacterium]|nr:phosphotransferase [Anaerolineales bacterium]
MNLPPEFISNVQGVLQEDGRRYVDALPDLVAEASAQWGLTDVQPVPNLSYNFVAFANRGESQVMLKIGLPNRETWSEMAALRLFNGEGACKLLEYDEEKYWMLLERLKPGVMLAALEDDEEATHIAAEVMKRIWVPLGDVTLSRLAAKSLPADVGDPSLSLRMTNTDKFIQLTDWFFGGFERLRKQFNGGTGPLDEKLVERAEGSARDFFAENHSPVLMHGDFHHYNILSSERGWLVIDPKGVLGPACYEVGPLMMNPWGSFPDGISRRLSLRRIDILHEHLGFERERICEWSLAHSVLSAWWGIEDNTGWEYSMAFAEMIASL